jgi:hypothetical protein
MRDARRTDRSHRLSSAFLTGLSIRCRSAVWVGSLVGILAALALMVASLVGTGSSTSELLGTLARSSSTSRASGEGGIWGPEEAAGSVPNRVAFAPLATIEGQTGEDSTIQSDDFNVCDLSTSVWTFEDPVGDSSYELSGTFTEDARLNIAIPSGSDHNVWDQGNRAPRMMQVVSDTDFEIEVKFDSALSKEYQMQGILVQESGEHFLRLEFHSDHSETRLFAAILERDSSPPAPLTHTVIHNYGIADLGVAPLWMRVRREGDQWQQYWSDDGVNWTAAEPFEHGLTVSGVGVFVGNAANPDQEPPAHTGSIDYFFNTGLPIDPEDGDRNELSVATVGDGAVTIVPERPAYDCGEMVTLTADPDAGWSFRHWSGDLSGADNPAFLAMDGSKTVCATFASHQIFLPLISRQLPDIFVGDFEAGDLTGFYWHQNKPEVVGAPHPVRAGQYSMMSYLHRYESPYSYRTEVIACREDDMPEDTSRPLRLNNTGGSASEYWIRFSTYVPSDFVVDVEGNSDILFQLHGNPDKDDQGNYVEGSRNPVLALEINADEWRVFSRWDDKPITPGPPFTYGGTHVYETPLGDSIGRWTDWQIHVRLSHETDGDGRLEVWKDGVQWIDQDGPNCYNDERGPHIALGVYKWAWEHDDPSNTDWRLFYHDELRIAGEAGG